VAACTPEKTEKQQQYLANRPCSQPTEHCTNRADQRHVKTIHALRASNKEREREKAKKEREEREKERWRNRERERETSDGPPIGSDEFMQVSNFPGQVGQHYATMDSPQHRHPRGTEACNSLKHEPTSNPIPTRPHIERLSRRSLSGCATLFPIPLTHASVHAVRRQAPVAAEAPRCPVIWKHDATCALEHVTIGRSLVDLHPWPLSRVKSVA